MTHLRKTLGLAEARAAVDVMLVKANDMGGRPIALIVCDDRGDVICQVAQAGVNVALARQNAFKKAYTSAVTRADTLAFAERVKDMPGGVAYFGNANFFAGGGGAVLVADDGTILGGIGVSGRTNEEDEEIAQTGKASVAASLGASA
jgi:glc operon protein GlcG